MDADNTVMFEQIYERYLRGDSILDICDDLGVSRTDIALAIELLSPHERRGMD